MRKKELTKEEKIKKEIRALNRLFKDMPDDVKRLSKSLIEKAAFMDVSLDELQNDINRKGYVSEYQNGANQWGTKKSPEVEIYNTLVKNHLAVMKQLFECLVKSRPDAYDDDGFDDFINNRDEI